MAESHELGSKAEAFAAEFLESRGYCILHKNWTYNHKELDIVCTDGKLLIVVEVKGRKRNSFLHPDDLLSRNQERFILEASEEYLYQYNVNMPVRFDLAAVIEKKNGMDLQYFEDAFIPGVE